MRNKKYAEAQTKLQALIDKLPPESRVSSQARVLQAECLVADGKLAPAKEKLQKIIDDTKDSGVKAAAYNALGHAFWLNRDNKNAPDSLRSAQWAFLWVDVVYNQDKLEQAKAMYFLAQIFQRLGDFDRAREYVENLLNDRQFAGSEYQRMAADLQKKLEEKAP
jgi:tetratricopeptide (TPR) repeat protein